MCGIIGVLAYGEFDTKKEEKIRQESMIFLASELLQITESRGKYATGIATLFGNCDFMGLKMGVTAQEFVSRYGDTEKDYSGFIDTWRKKTSPAKIVLGHCRNPSVGGSAGPEDNNNNHPIKIGNIVGIHNGTLDNHTEIFKNLGCDRDGKVDSEAIFRLLNHYTNDGMEPFSLQGLQETCKRLEGSYSVLSFSGNNPYQVAGFRDGRPMEIAMIRPLKLVLIASDKKFLRAVINRYNKMSHLYQTGPHKFKMLTKNDVDTDIVVDDSLHLFDIRNEIGTDTKVSDLYITEKVPRAGKIWKKPPAYSTKNKNVSHNNYGKGFKDKKTKKEVEAKAHTSHETAGKKIDGNIKKEKRIGLVWNGESEKHEAFYHNNKVSLEHGDVEVDCESGEIIDADSKKIFRKGEKKIEKSHSTQASKQNITLHEVNTNVDNLITDPAKISEVEIKDTGVIAIHKNNKTTTPAKDILKTETTVNTRVYPDVMERADIVTKEQKNFSNDEDLVNALEITNPSGMKEMSLYSLANRIKKFFFKKGWIGGYIERLREEERGDESRVARTMLVRNKKRLSSAEDTIRNMKTMTRILNRIMSKTLVTDNLIKSSVSDTLSSDEEISVSSLAKVYKAGDYRDQPILRKIMMAITADK